MSFVFPNIPNLEFKLFEKLDYPKDILEIYGREGDIFPIIAVSSNQLIWRRQSGKWFRCQESVSDDGVKYIIVSAMDTPPSFVTTIRVDYIFEKKFGKG